MDAERRRFHLAVIGDFDKYPRQCLQAFVRESNRGRQVFFRRFPKHSISSKPPRRNEQST